MRLSLTSLAALATCVALVGCDELRTGIEPLPIGATLDITPDADTIFVADTLTAADSARFVAVVRSFSGDSSSPARARWSSSDPTVAVVSQTGLVTARGPGEAIITVDAGERASARIVILAAVRNLVIAPVLDTLLEGDSTRLMARALDQGGATVSGVRYTWSSSDQRVATVDSTGLVRAIQAGAARITVRAGGLQTGADIVVEAPPIVIPPFP